MRDVMQVLREKELKLARVQREVEALTLAATLLVGEDNKEEPKQPAVSNAVPTPKKWPSVNMP